MAILKIKKLIEDLENGTTQVVTGVSYASSAANAGSSSYASTSAEAGSAAYSGTASVAKTGTSGSAL